MNASLWENCDSERNKILTFHETDKLTSKTVGGEFIANLLVTATMQVKTSSAAALTERKIGLTDNIQCSVY